MSLTLLCAAIVDELQDVTGVTTPDQPTPNVPDAKMLFVYPNIGNTKPASHRGSTGPVIECRDTLVVEFHMPNPLDALAYGIQQTTPILDAVRDTLWAGYAHGAFRAAGLTILHAVNTESFGNMGWGKQDTFGFRLTLDVSHAMQLTV